jgi:hypothetical protein
MSARIAAIATLAGAVSGGALAMAGAVSGGEEAGCDDLARRLDGQSPRVLAALWRRLGLSSRLFADAPSGPLRAAFDARAHHVVVSVTAGAATDWQYLVFARRSQGCRFVGAVDVPARAPEPPSHRMVALPEGQTALAVRATARSGTGLALVRETWYLLGEARLTVILDYPVRGHLIGWPSTFDRSFATAAVPRVTAGAVDEIRVEFRASYTSGSYIHWMPVEPLFESTRQAHYAWKPGARRFVLDPVRSDFYGDEIEGLFHDAEEQFLLHNVQELARLARLASEGQRAWLRHFLDSVPDSPEKRAVMENLP